MAKSKYEKIYEEKTGLNSITNDCRYSNHYVVWLEQQLEKRIIELEATEEAMKEAIDEYADLILKL